MQYLLIMYIYSCTYKYLGSFVVFWWHTNEKVSMLVHKWEGPSSSDIINVERTLEGIHLWRDIFTLYNKCNILELV